MKAEARAADKEKKTSAKRTGICNANIVAAHLNIPTPSLLTVTHSLPATKRIATPETDKPASGIPYVVLKHVALSKLCHEKNFTASVNIFKVQLPSLDACKTTKRASQLLGCDRMACIIELMRNCAPSIDCLDTLVSKVPASIGATKFEPVPNLWADRRICWQSSRAECHWQYQVSDWCRKRASSNFRKNLGWPAHGKYCTMEFYCLDCPVELTPNEEHKENGKSKGKSKIGQGKGKGKGKGSPKASRRASQ